MLFLQLINYFQKLNRILISTSNINFKLPRLYVVYIRKSAQSLCCVCALCRGLVPRLLGDAVSIVLTQALARAFSYLLDQLAAHERGGSFEPGAEVHTHTHTHTLSLSLSLTLSLSLSHSLVSVRVLERELLDDSECINNLCVLYF